MLFFGADNFLRESIPVNLFLNRILLYHLFFQIHVHASKKASLNETKTLLKVIIFGIPEKLYWLVLFSLGNLSQVWEIQSFIEWNIAK
jgi:hypothetical protein